MTVKKKLKDVSMDEYKKWKAKKCKFMSCSKCLFEYVHCIIGEPSWVNHKELYSDNFLNQKISVESDW